MFDVLLDTMIDCLKLMPFLLITYLIMEYIEHKTSAKLKQAVEKSGRYGPILGGLVGAFPQCGFAAAAANLYAGRVISMGTLIAVFLSTSDEMLPIFISEAVSPIIIMKILGLKVIIGISAGYIIDKLWRVKHVKESMNIKKFCEHENCNCENGIFKSAIKHTVQITIFIFVISIILNMGIELFGEDIFSNLLLNRPILGEMIAGLFGLIPNCAASVIITQLYLQGVIGSGAMMSGLLISAGTGILILFKVNTSVKESFKIMGLLYVIGVTVGIIIELLGVHIG